MVASMFSTKYKFKEDFKFKLCTDFESLIKETDCSFYENFIFKKGDVFEAVNNTNVDPIFKVGFAKNMPFKVPLNILEKVSDLTPITDIIEVPILAKKTFEANKKNKNVKKMFILPTVLVLVVIWVFGLKKL